MNRKEYLDTVKAVICEHRPDIHGKPENCFKLIADYWQVFLKQKLQHDVKLSPADVAVMMSLFKTARWQVNPNFCDNVVDNIGYLALAGELQDQSPLGK